LTPDATRVAPGGTHSAEAYQFYLQGRYQWTKRSPASLTRAIDYFDRAVARDPSYALAYAGLAQAYLSEAFAGPLTEAEAYPKAISHARKALDLDDRVADAHAVLGYGSVEYGWDWTTSDREFKRALDLDPNNATTHGWIGFINLLSRGRYDEAIAQGRQAKALDPLSPMIREMLGDTFAASGRLDDAREAYLQALELEPDFIAAHVGLVAFYQLSSRFDLAIAQSQRLVELGSPLGRPYLAGSYAVAGRHAEALQIVMPLTEAARQSHRGASSLALAFAALGNADQAMAWLEEAYKNHDFILPL
jgi:serine/threonine-protein kinase